MLPKLLVNRSLSQFKPSALRPLLAVLARSGLREFSSSKTATKPSSIRHQLLQELNSEIVAQNTLIEEYKESLEDTSAVMEEFSEMLQAGGWEVNRETGSSEVAIRRSDENGAIAIKFDMNDVVNGSAIEDEMDEEDMEESEAAEAEAEEPTETEAEAEAEAADLEDDFGSTYTSYPIVVEVTKGDKTMYFDCLAELTEDDPILSVENISSSTSVSSYAPVYENLDSELKEKFSKFIGKAINHKEMLNFIALYAEAEEAREYQNWLEQVRDFIKA